MTVPPLTVLISPDKFKGSLTAAEVAAALADGFDAADSKVAVRSIQAPVADGGEGTVQAAVSAGFVPHRATVLGPTGVPVDAEFAYNPDTATAVVELATASGLDLLPGGVLAPLTATCHGTGQLIGAALDLGAKTIILGVGGSANTDGGAGLISGLGAKLLDAAGNELPHGGAALAELATVDFTDFDSRVEHVNFVLAADVDNPLLGERGAPAIFGPQKGASEQDVATLDAALANLVDKLAQARPDLDIRGAAEAPGAGAAGGAGYMAMAVFGADRRRGIDVIIDFVGLKEKIKDADLVIVGEGSLDHQSLLGKAPVGVADLAHERNIPVVAVAGRCLLTAEQITQAGFAKIYALADREPDPQKSMANAAALLKGVAAEILTDHTTMDNED